MTVEKMRKKRNFSDLDRDDSSDEDSPQPKPPSNSHEEPPKADPLKKYAKRNTEQSISDAKARYLARKRARALDAAD